MEKLTRFFVAIVIHLASSAVAPSFGDDSELKPDPTPGSGPGNSPFVEGCVGKLNDKCETEIYGALLTTEIVKDECCISLVNMGKACHDVLVGNLLEMAKITAKENALQIWSKSDQIWNQCGSYRRKAVLLT